MNEQVVDDLGAFAVDLRIDLVDEGAVLLGEIDAGIVGGGDHPYRFAFERIGPSPDAQVMALREGVVDLLEDQVGRLVLQEQDGDGRFLIAALLGDGAEGFQLGLAW